MLEDGPAQPAKGLANDYICGPKRPGRSGNLTWTDARDCLLSVAPAPPRQGTAGYGQRKRCPQPLGLDPWPPPGAPEATSRMCDLISSPYSLMTSCTCGHFISQHDWDGFSGEPDSYLSARRLRGRCTVIGCKCRRFVAVSDRPVATNRYLAKVLRKRK
jgi:hypothetical protein